MVMLIGAAGSCERSAGSGSERGAGRSVEAPRSRWVRIDGETIVTLDDDVEAAMAAAIEQARATADRARAQWSESQDPERSNWLVKWAAPLADGGCEYVWVEPRSWSRFRIEGVLRSAPVHGVGAKQGDYVGFPIEDLADWVHLLDGRLEGPRQGGFTIDVLEQRYGRPG
jgi:uncharacterized protein YegJ (DUF2314 family)